MKWATLSQFAADAIEALTADNAALRAELAQLRSDIADGRLVRVVRCKDCKKWHQTKSHFQYGHCEDLPAPEDLTFKDDYCRWGERREAALAAQEVQG